MGSEKGAKLKEYALRVVVSISIGALVSSQSANVTERLTDRQCRSEHAFSVLPAAKRIYKYRKEYFAWPKTKQMRTAFQNAMR